MAAHEFWRLNMTANDGGPVFAMAEVEMRATVGGADQCTGGTATASASSGSFLPPNAVDDDPSTLWGSPSATPRWWRYQFPAPVEVLEYTIQAHPTAGNRSPRDWTLEHSDDGSSWAVADTRTGETGWANGEIRTFEAVATPSEARATQTPVLVLTAAAAADTRATQGVMLVMGQPAASARITQAVVLALTEEPAGARVTQAPVLVLADHVPCLTRWAQVWTITRTDGEVLGFTSLDRDVTFKGVVHKSCHSMAATAVDMSSIVGGQGSQELRGLLSAAGVDEVDLYHGLYDGALLESWMVPWDNAGGELPTPLIRGVLGRDSHDVNEFSIELLTDSAKLQQTAMLETYTATCRYGFGTSNDSRCPVDLGPLTVSGSVTGTEALIVPNNGARRIFTDSTRGEADGHFDLGQIAWTSGPNAGTSSEIKSFVGGRFELWDATPSPIALGDGYDATPGCNKSTTDHLRFNADLVDFGGFPHVPGNDSAFDTPDSRES